MSGDISDLPGQSLRLRRELLHCPITALAFSRTSRAVQCVLAGEDGFLRLYEEDDDGSYRPSGRLGVFSSQAIHGIEVSQAAVLVWGGRSVAVLPTAAVEGWEGEGKSEAPAEVCAPDWIYDGSVSPYDERRGVVVTAHNEIIPLSIDADGDGRGIGGVSLGDPVSPSRPILYSAAVSWTSPTSVLVAAGTVFGEIVVWEYHAGSEEDTRPPRAEVLFVLTGHEGSIFGVDISPEMELEPGGPKTRLLASCSDDRTVRIWDITKEGSPCRQGSVEQVLDERLVAARETGFLSSESQNATPGEPAPPSRCFATAMSHASRIWHVKFWLPHAGGPASVYSFGEDATAQKWELSLDSSGRSGEPLANVGRVLCHGGKHIWSAALAPREGASEPLIATGGADGKITHLCFPESRLSKDHVATGPSFMLSYHQVLESLPSPASFTEPDNKPARDGFLRYAFLTEKRLLVSTLSGRMLLAEFDEAGSLSWLEVDVPSAVREDLRGYNVVKSPRSGIAFLGSPHGTVYVYCETYGVRRIATLTGKITDILCLSTRTGEGGGIRGTGEDGTVSILVTVLGDSEATLFEICTSSADCAVAERSPVALERGIATSAGFCGEFLVVGKRTGVVTVYERTAGGFACRALRSDCKNKDAITSIVPLPPPDGCPASSFLTTCRDGRYRIYEIQRHPETETTLLLRHETSPPLGPMLEGALLLRPRTAPDALELVIYGFRGKNFVVWNETRRQEVAAVACGGAHRTFDYVPSGGGEGVRLVYTKASQMGVYSQSKMPLRTVRHGSHGREIRAVAASTKHVATAGEDTCLRIWGGLRHAQAGASVVGSSFPLSCRAVLEKHSAGIQRLAWHGDEYLLSSAGSEELFVWRVAELASKYEGLSVVCEAVYPDRTRDGDLRITTFDVAEDKKAADASAMLISLVLSNSTLKTYRYSRETGFRLLATGTYTGACLTQVHHLGRGGGNDEQTLAPLLTASTDGHVVVWRDAGEEREDSSGEHKACGNTKPYSAVLAAKLHQSAIKCLDVRAIQTDEGDARWVVVTGGDDNALGILDIEWSSSGFAVLGRARVRDAHAAAVTGIAIVEAGENTPYTMVVATASNDQRIKIWSVGGVAGRRRVALVDDRYSAVADPGDLALVGPGQLMVGGVGMEMWWWGKK